MLWTNYRNTSSRWTPPWTHVPGPGSILWSFFTTLLSFLKSHRGMFLTVQGAAEFYVLDEIITDALKRKLSESAPAAGFDPELTARFYAGACSALIRWWLSSGADVPDEVLLRHVEHFIPQPRAPGLERRNPTHVTNIKL